MGMYFIRRTDSDKQELVEAADIRDCHKRHGPGTVSTPGKTEPKKFQDAQHLKRTTLTPAERNTHYSRCR